MTPPNHNYAATTHENTMVINGLAQSGNLPLAYDAMIDGGVTATNLTVAANEDFRDGVREVECALRTMEEHPRRDRLALITSTDEIREAKATGKSGVIIGFQNADPIEDDLAFLRVFYRLGLRILQLTYQRRNLLGDGCGEEANGGLGTYGKQVIAECNRLGVLLDLSHVGHRSTMEAISVSERPVAVTHANLFSVNPIPRNKKDEIIEALAEREGVFGFTSVSRLLSAAGNQEGASLDQYLDQIDHVVSLVGIDYVGVGLDISEGMTQEQFVQRRATFLTKFPELKMGGDFPLEHYFARGLSSAAMIGNITRGLIERGYDDKSVSKIMGGNFLRVFEAAWG